MIKKGSSGGPFQPGSGRASIAPGYQQAQGTGGQRYWFFIHYFKSNYEEPKRVPQTNRTEDSQEAKLRRVEAVLFLTNDGLTSRKLAKLAGLADATEARTLVRQLNSELDRDGRSYRVEEIASGYALMTRSHFAPWLRRLSHIPGEQRLTQSVLETLAVVAYRQPVLRANIEAIRGVGCSEVLKQLMEMELVRISGRSEDLGRPYLYGTTRRFLQMFGLRSADRLPRIDWVNEPQLSLSSPEFVGTDSENKESMVNMSFSATATLEDASAPTDEELLNAAPMIPSAVDEDEDDWDDDDDDDDDDDSVDDVDSDDDEEWDDDDEDSDADEVSKKGGDDDDEEDDDDEDDEEEGGWEEVDDDDEWDDDDDDDDSDDDWDDDEDDDDEDWD
ncbi:SMC-Scp complex subunit ScpB [Aureliella helgolandensis]|uniref:Segregation and condensation protein B n=1 Tax=Aureliella helgolandensis TaxID=2527968 RepID=A0A518GHS4_9BACT|nr:SMC-Scp complex subunit ScpB [Aureliella helgolandensis]QDV28137.1 Segregation and condensation protein B [Aureliella helgolandensis]